MEENLSHRKILRPVFTQSDLSVHRIIIYLLMCTYTSTSSTIMELRRAKEVSLELVFIGYHIGMELLNAKLCMIKNG